MFNTHKYLSNKTNKIFANKKYLKFLIKKPIEINPSYILCVDKNMLVKIKQRVYKNTKYVFCSILKNYVRYRNLIIHLSKPLSNMVKYLNTVTSCEITCDNLPLNNYNKLFRSLMKFPNLRELTLIKFNKISKNIYKMNKLTKLVIYISKINKISNYIDKLTNLKTFSCYNTELKKLPKNIGKLINLQELNCYHNNHLIKLPKSITLLQNLKLITCEKYTAIPAKLNKTIKISHNTTIQYYDENNNDERQCRVS
jgi:hypothetical protein